MSVKTCRRRIDIWCIIIVLITAQESLSLKGLKILVPEVVNSGDTVTLSCEYDLEQVALYSINWYWNGHEFYRFVPKESPPYRDFSVPHFNIDLFRSGPSQVILRDVRRQLSGRYECEVSCDAPLFQTGHENATMTVAEMSSDDLVVDIRPRKVEIGSKVEANCSAPASYPPANVTWFINGDRISEDTESVKIYSANNGTDTTMDLHAISVNIEITTDRSHFLNGILLVKCEASVLTLWRRNIEIPVRELAVQQISAPSLGSVSSQQSRINNYEEIGISSSNASNRIHRCLRVAFLLIFFSIFCRR